VDSASENQLRIGRGRYFSALYHLECVYYAAGGIGRLGSHSETSGAVYGGIPDDVGFD